MNISKELDFLPDDSLLLTALIKKTYDVAKNLIDENLFTKAEIKYLEQKLKDSEKKYRIFIENFNGIAFQGYQDFPDAFFEGNVEEMTGYTEEDFTSGRIKWNEIIYPDDLERINNAVKKFYSTPINCDSREYRIIHKNGKVRWVMENIHKLYVNKKKEEIVQGNIIDITERKKADEKFRKTKVFSDSVLDSLPGIFYLFDEKGKFMRWNKNFEEVSGYSGEEISKMSILDFFKGEDKKYIAERIQEVFVKGKSTAEANFISKSGRKTPHYFTGLRIIINNISYLGGMGIDISERKKAEKKLQESEKRYRDFISVASHEFKTPLIPIIGIPHLILKDTNLTEQQKDFINEILISGKKLNELMDNLLDTTKIDAKSIELTKREMAINPLINSCISDLAFLMKHNNHTVIKRLKENVKLNIDDKKISRVLTNLILNAIKYTPRNGKIEISTQIDAADNFIFSIKDNGIGIDDKDAELVFQKFGKIRGAEMSQYKLDTYGTGLGLYISKEIIKLHGGEIWFESEGRNKGTTFNFKLPIKDN